MTPFEEAAESSKIALDRIRADKIESSDALAIHDTFVRDTTRRIRQCGVIERVEEWAAEDAKGLGGAPEKFSKEALLVVMFICARLSRPMLVTQWQLIIETMTPTARAELGLPDPPAITNRKAHKAYYRNLRTRFHALERLFDFSLYPRNRRYTEQEMTAVMATEKMIERLAELTPERVEVLRGRLTWFINRILRISHQAAPRELLSAWQGGLAIDATPVSTFARHPAREPKSKQRRDRRILVFSTDPEGGWYIREGDHSDVDQLPGGGTPTKHIYAYEHTHATLGALTKAERGRYPKLVASMVIPHIPGESPGRNGRRAIDLAKEAMAELGFIATRAIGDNAYVNARPEDFAIPLRASGIELVIDYNSKQRGLQGEHDGANLVEGWWYCPAMPQALVDATADHANGTIDYTTYQRRLADRVPYEFRIKDRGTDGSIRIMCPAAGTAKTARCDHKPGSLTRATLGKRRIDLNHILASHPPKACTQETITVPAAKRGRFEQPLRVGTEPWRVAYQTLRSTDEGGFGTAKDPNHQGLEDARRRRIRGKAANALLTCFMICAENLRAISSWANKATPDENNVYRLHYSPRRRRADLRPQQVTPVAASPPGAPT